MNTDLTQANNMAAIKNSHKYHKDCIDNWLLISNVCPLCKTKIKIKKYISDPLWEKAFWDFMS